MGGRRGAVRRVGDEIAEIQHVRHEGDVIAVQNRGMGEIDAALESERRRVRRPLEAVKPDAVVEGFVFREKLLVGFLVERIFHVEVVFVRLVGAFDLVIFAVPVAWAALEEFDDDDMGVGAVGRGAAGDGDIDGLPFLVDAVSAESSGLHGILPVDIDVQRIRIRGGLVGEGERARPEKLKVQPCAGAVGGGGRRAGAERRADAGLPVVRRCIIGRLRLDSPVGIRVLLGDDRLVVGVIFKIAVLVILIFDIALRREIGGVDVQRGGDLLQAVRVEKGGGCCDGESEENEFE